MNMRYLNSPLWIWFSLLPVLLFGIYVFLLALNVPYNDDVTLISTLNKINNPDFSFLQTILEQQNDHRVVFSRLATLLIYWFHGTMNFRTMIILGYLNLIFLAYAFYLIFKSEKQPFFYFVPVCILLFSPIVQATHLWGITSFEYTLSIAFSLYSLYFLQPSRQRFWFFAMPFAMAATLSNLDGLCVIPVGLVWLLIQKRTKESLIYSGFMSLYLYLFFMNFHFSPSTASPSFPGFIGIVLKGFISFAGAIVKVISDSHAYSLSLIAGGLFIGIFLFFMIRRFFLPSVKTNMLLPVSFTDISFLELLACAFMVALGRAAHAAESMVAIRFQIYAVTTLILFYLIVISNVSNAKLKSVIYIIFFCGAVTLNFLSYIKYHDSILYHNDELKADAYNFNSNALFIHQFPGLFQPDRNFYQYYQFPEYLKTEEVANWKTRIKGQSLNSKITLKGREIPGLTDNRETFYPVVNLEIANLPDYVPGKNVYLAFFKHNASDKPFVVALRPEIKGWLGRMFSEQAAAPLYSVRLTKKIPDNFYDVAVCWVDQGVPGSLLVARNFKMEKTTPVPGHFK